MSSMGKREAGQLYGVAKAILTPAFSFLFNVIVEGKENVPEAGGAIIAPNHISVLDSFFVPSVLPRRITYVGKAEYMDSWKTKYLFPAMGMIPIDRSGGDSAKAALDAAAGILERGELFGIYPEGTRSRDGLLHKGHTGAARLAMRTGCPIVPVGVQGTVEVMPPDAKLPSPFRTVRIRIGKPIDVTRYLDRPNERMALRQITDEVMYEIRALSGQTYVDEYATKKSEALPAETAKISREGSEAARSGNGSRGGSDAAAEASDAGADDAGGTGDRGDGETKLAGAVEKLRQSSSDVLNARH
jgi:1-acyl-sn-glycerol-3-phosphate acyltransferase